MLCILLCQPEKTADAPWRHHWFPRKMTSERRSQKFLTDDASLVHVLLIGLAAWEICLYQSEAPPDLGSDASSVWNFCTQTSFSGETSQLASRNVGCFLRLLLCMCANLSIFFKWKRSTFPPPPVSCNTPPTKVTAVGWEFRPYFLCWRDLHHL